jgi:hypothetical protein
MTCGALVLLVVILFVGSFAYDAWRNRRKSTERRDWD